MEDTPEESSGVTSDAAEISGNEGSDDGNVFKVPQGLPTTTDIHPNNPPPLNLNSLAVSTVIPQLDYTPPHWACEPASDLDYGFDVIKNGTLIETFKFSERRFPTYIVIGRLDTSDIQLNHPSISRYHCILQYGDDIMSRTGKGWHIYDLSSTHGTKLNKRRVPPKQYIRIRVGHVIQFGGSSRILNLIGPSTDTEAELEYSPTELRKMKEEKRLAEEAKKASNKGDAPVTACADGSGNSSDSDYDEDYLYAKLREDYEADGNEEKYQKDPLKVLSHFFEHEGFDMEFSFTEVGAGNSRKWCCTIELPVDTAAGQSLSASATCEGSKKQAQIACALNACRTLDMHGVLYRAANVRRRAEKALAENDYYDSDEDTFFDRTGQIEKSRENRRRRALEAQGKLSEEKDTYETLLKKIAGIEEEMRTVEKRLSSLSGIESDMQKSASEDDLDAYCRKLEITSHDDLATRTEKSQHRLRLTELKHEKERLEKLAKIVKPVSLPELKVAGHHNENASDVQRTAGVSAAMMKKIMQLRRAKKETANSHSEKDEEFPAENANTDEKPFVVEEENDDEIIASANLNSLSAPTSSTVDGDGKDITTALETNVASDTTCIKKAEANASNDSVTLEEPVMQESTDKRKLAGVDSADLPSKRRRMRIRGERGNEKGSSAKTDYDGGYLGTSDDYITWLPPDAQTGDGKTALNAKFAGRY